jgi:hypothetical protein
MVLMRDLSKLKVAVKSYRILYTTVLLGYLLYLGSANTVYSSSESSLLHGVDGYYNGNPKQAEIKNYPGHTICVQARGGSKTT